MSAASFSTGTTRRIGSREVARAYIHYITLSLLIDILYLSIGIIGVGSILTLWHDCKVRSFNFANCVGVWASVLSFPMVPMLLRISRLALLSMFASLALLSTAILTDEKDLAKLSKVQAEVI